MYLNCGGDKPKDPNEEALYAKLSHVVMPTDLLEKYKYPVNDPNEPTMCKVPDRIRSQLKAQLANSSFSCARCATPFSVDGSGLPEMGGTMCVSHPGRLVAGRHKCCQGLAGSPACARGQYHVHEGDLLPDRYKNFVETQPKQGLEPNRHGVYALDCEMSFTTIGLEITKVTVVDYKYDIVYEKLVRPENPVLNYNTEFSGIRPGDLVRITTRLRDVQRDLLNMFSSKTIIVGHSLEHDMFALKILHKTYADTSQLYPHRRGLPFKNSLKYLMETKLGMTIQATGSGHDSGEDSRSALRLVKMLVGF